MKNNSGPKGEAYTAAFLKKHGYHILAQNFHSRFGELDIVAANKAYIVFVEVKARGKNPMVSPLESVNKTKQQKLLLTAQYYLQINPSKLQPRFDVAGLTIVGDQIADFIYLENAFTA